jgi:hypothetical protein
MSRATENMFIAEGSAYKLTQASMLVEKPSSLTSIVGVPRERENSGGYHPGGQMLQPRCDTGYSQLAGQN